MPKRKRRRTRIKPGPILVLAIVFVFVAGFAYSPLTSVSKVDVTGAHPADRSDIQNVLSTLNGIPRLMVNTRWVETRVERIQAVDRAVYSQNIFGRGHLDVVYRVPVARIKGDGNIGIDAAGVMFVTDQLADDLPVVFRPDSAKDLPLTLASGFPSTSVAQLAVKARQLDPKEKISIWFDNEGALCLTIGGGVVVLGACDDLDEKLQALKDLLQDEPDLLTHLQKLNLTEPTRPTKTYKKQGR